MEKIDRAGIAEKLLAVSGLVLFLNLFFFHHIGPVAYALFSTGFFLFLLAVFTPGNKRRKNASMTRIFFLAVVLSNIVLTTRLSFFTTGLVFLFSLTTIALFIYISTRGTGYLRSLGELVLFPFILTADYLKGGLTLLSSLFDQNSDLWKVLLFNRPRKIKSLIPLILGLGIGIPVVGLLVSLLSGADPIYSSYVGRFTGWLMQIFRGGFWESFLQRVIISFFFFGLFSPFVYLSGKGENRLLISPLGKYPVVATATVIILLVGITLGSYLLVEWPYVFARVAYETDLSQFGVATYSEYVKRGFTELLSVSLLVYTIIWAGLICLRSGRKKGERTILPLLQMTVILEFLVFLISVGRRVYLYQSYHGWSLGRIYGGILLVWILGFTVTLLFRHFWHRRWVIAETVFTAVLVLGTGAFNAERFIALTHPPTVNKRTDYVYLSRFYPQGFDGWVKAFEYARTILTDDIKNRTDNFPEDKRREIAYAGIIVHQLTRNYDELITDFGSEGERREYYRDMLLWKKEETALYPWGYPPDRINLINNQINRDLEDLSAKTDPGFRPHYYISSWPFVLNFDPPNALRFYHIYHLTDGDASGNKSSNLNTLDKIFMWNYSRQAAYSRIVREIPYREIIFLQKRFYELYQKIAGHPSNDRSYNADISPDGPFLQPL